MSNHTTTTGWEKHNRGHFDDITEKYDKVRQSYPSELFADIFRYNTPTPSPKAIEIGAGTGKATAPFLNAGYNVTAIEISPNMAKFLQERFPGDNFKVITAPFEDTELDENTYDLIYAATAFHWVDADIGCPKTFRLLKSGGAFALFRCNVFPGDNVALNDEIQSVYDTHYYSHYKFNQKPVKLPHSELSQPHEIKRGFGFSDLGAYGFEDITMKFYDAKRIFTADEYITTLETFSDHKQLPESNKTALFTGIREAIQKHGNQHEIDYTYKLYMGRKPISSSSRF